MNKNDIKNQYSKEAIEELLNIDDLIFDSVHNVFGFNKGQLLLADCIIYVLESNYPNNDYIDLFILTEKLKDFNIIMTKKDEEYVLSKLSENGIIEKYYDANNFYKLTTLGKEIIQKYPNYITYAFNIIKYQYKQKEENQIKEKRKNSIESLTEKQLKAAIFQYKYFYFFMIASGLIGFVFSLIIYFLTKN